MKKFGGEVIDPIEALKTCRPSSEDMKKFISRLSQFDFSNRSRLVGKLLPSEKKIELERVKKKQSSFLNHFICKGVNCNEKEIVEKLTSGAAEVSKEIKLACENKLPLARVSQQKNSFIANI